MELSAKQQTTELIKKSERILIIGSKVPDGDTIGSIVALSLILKKLDKKSVSVISGGVSANQNFLSNIESIKKELEGKRDLVIKLDVKDNPVDKLSYNVKEGTLNIIITPEGETYDDKKIETSKGSYDFDLVIVLDTPNVGSIDKVYDEITELFLEKPIINIDHHADNDFFGTVNLVDTAATSTAEILVAIAESLGVPFDQDIATDLLAGIIYDTGSFANKNTTPKSLTVAAQLLAAGARKQEIVKSLHKSRPFETVRFWGKVLGSIKYNEELRFVWAKVSNEDFEDSKLELDETVEIIEGLSDSAPDADVALLLVESEKGKVLGRIKGYRSFDVLKLAEGFGGKGEFYNAEFEVENITFSDIEGRIIKSLEEELKNKLGIRDESEGKRTFVPLQKLNKEKLPKADQNDFKDKVEFVEDDAVAKIRDLIEENSEVPTEEAENPDDGISEAIKSLEKEETQDNEASVEKKSPAPKNEEAMTPLSDVLKDRFSGDNEDEIFDDDEDEVIDSENEIVHKDEDEGKEEIRVWRE